MPALQPVVHSEPLTCQTPFWSQSCGCLPLHSTAPGVHSPAQIPPEQIKLQVFPGTQVPVALHCSGTSTLQVEVPGVHSPVHAPPLQTYWQGVPAFCQSLALLQV